MKSVADLGRGDLSKARDRWRKQIAFINDNKMHLDFWEKDFMRNVTRRQNQKHDLSFQQSVTLNNIYAKVVLAEPLKEPPL